MLPGFGLGTNIDLGFYDCFGEAGHQYLTYGLGAEYHPVSCPDVRLHAFVANRATSHEADAGKTVTTNSLQFNVGITWDMNIHRMIKDRMMKNQ